MRRALSLLIITCGLPLIAFAESEGYARAFFFLNLNHVNPVKFENPAAVIGRTVVYIECPFASPVFNNSEEAKELKGHIIEKVQLVYTTYRQDESF